MKKFLLFLMAVSTVALVGCGNTNEKEEVNLNEDEEINQQIEMTEDTEDSKLADRETIFDLFDAYIEEQANVSGEELSAYRIENVMILNDEDKNAIVQEFSGDYFETDILAAVTFSVKPMKSNSMWLAGNGEESGDWIYNKSLLVTLRDGELVNVGTGW